MFDDELRELVMADKNEFLEDLKHHNESTQTKAKTSSSTSNTCSENTINITCQTDPNKLSNEEIKKM